MWKPVRENVLGSVASAARIAPFLLAVALGMYFVPSPFQLINNEVYDIKLLLMVQHEPCSEIVHLNIDDEAVRRIAPWPWDYSLYARITDRLREFGADLIVFELSFYETGNTEQGHKQFVSALKKAPNVVTGALLGIVGPDKNEPVEGGDFTPRKSCAGRALGCAWHAKRNDLFECRMV